MADLQIPKVITSLSSLLQRLSDANDSGHPRGTTTGSIFDGRSRPSISIQKYMERIFRYADCSPSCFVVAFVYLNRFVQRRPSLPVTSFNVHRLLITSVVVAVKFMDDLYYNNGYYSKIGGINIREMNFLEMEFLFSLGFHLNVTPTTFNSYCNYIQREIILLESPLLLPKPHLHLQYCNFSEEESTSQNQHLAL